jgi:capsid protein
MDTFDAGRVIATAPWYDKAISAIAPQWGLRRMESRMQAALFSYNAAQTNRLYAPKQYGLPSESNTTTRDRIVMMWEARDLVENFPEAREISRKFGNYLTPHEYSPTTGDRQYNAVVAEYFHEWCKTCDVTGRHTFKKLIQLAAEQRPIDGDCGFIVRRVDGELKIQLVPGTRLGNPNSLGADPANYFQGIFTNEFGRPISYRIFRVTREGVYYDPEDIEAQFFCHYYDPFRVDQYRGITDLHAAIRTARMLYEILEAEKAGVRFASQQAALVFSDRGTANPRNLFTPTPASTLPNGQTQKNELSEIGNIRYFGTADKVEVMPSRPSEAFSGFVQHLMHEIAIGVGIPEGVLFGTQNYKGPSVRADFAAADRVFTRHQGVLQDKVLDPIKNQVILDAIARDLIPPPPRQAGETVVQSLKRATRGEWRFPAKLTIDIGRESTANMNENRQGAKSLQEIAAEEGTDAFGRLEQIAIEANFISELAARYNVPETSIRMVTQQLPANPAMAAALGEQVTQTAVDAVNETAKGAADAKAGSTDAASNPSQADSELHDQRIVIDFAEDGYVPNDSMASNAKRALDVREAKPASERGMTAVGLARARDIINKRALSADTVRRMKAYFDRHEVDKQGSTWDQQGKGWQAWNGWGGDAGRTWANAIVERLNRKENADGTNKVELKSEVEADFAARKMSSKDWLASLAAYRTAMQEKKKQFIIPSPGPTEKSEEFIGRCMGDATMVTEFPDETQRYAVCQRQINPNA